MRNKIKRSGKFNPQEILWDFLRRLDRKLRRPIKGYLIGGGGLVLAFGIPRFTADLDFLRTEETEELGKILEANREEFKDLVFQIQLLPPDWFPLPEDYETKAARLPGRGLKRLQIWVLEKEDLILAKLARGSSKDFEDIRWLAGNFPIEAEGLLERYRRGRKNLGAGLPRVDRAFLYLMRDLFGKDLKQKDLESS